MSHKKFFPIGIVCAIVWFAVEWAWGYAVMNRYVEINRSAGIPWHQPTMHGWVALVITALLFGYAFAAIFLAGYEGKGAMEGVRLAIWMTLAASIMENIGYASMIDFGRHFTGAAIVGDFVMFLLCGIIAAAMAGTASRAAA